MRIRHIVNRRGSNNVAIGIDRRCYLLARLTGFHLQNLSHYPPMPHTMTCCPLVVISCPLHTPRGQVWLLLLHYHFRQNSLASLPRRTSKAPAD